MEDGDAVSVEEPDDCMCIALTVSTFVPPHVMHVHAKCTTWLAFKRLAESPGGADGHSYNAVMPLYIDYVTWQRAAPRMAELCRCMGAGFPFLVLDQAYRQILRRDAAWITPRAEFFRRQLIQTCEHLEQFDEETRSLYVSVRLRLARECRLDCHTEPSLRVLFGMMLTARDDDESGTVRQCYPSAPYLLLEAARRSVRLDRRPWKEAVSEWVGIDAIAAPPAVVARWSSVPAVMDRLRMRAEGMFHKGPLRWDLSMLRQYFDPAGASSYLAAHWSAKTAMAFYLWAHAHASDAMPPLSDREIPDPWLQPDRCIESLLDRVFADAVGRSDRWPRRPTDPVLRAYLAGTDVAFPLASVPEGQAPHLFRGSRFGRLLREVRALRRNPGSIALAREKFQFLCDAYHWSPSAWNERAWAVHFAASTITRSLLAAQSPPPSDTRTIAVRHCTKAYLFYVWPYEKCSTIQVAVSAGMSRGALDHSVRWAFHRPATEAVHLRTEGRSGLEGGDRRIEGIEGFRQSEVYVVEFSAAASEPDKAE